MKKVNLYLCIILILNFYSGLKFANAQDNLVDWKFTNGNSYHSSPIHYNNTIYIGGMDGNLYALDAQTGSEKWKYNSQQPILSTPLIHNNMVMFTSGGKIFALNLEDGSEVWSWCSNTQSTIAQIDSWDYHHSSPYLHEDVVYYGDDWGNLNGVNTNSGELVFQYTTSNEMEIRSTPEISDGVVFFGDWGGIIYAVRLFDSSLVWSYTPYETLPYEGFGATSSKFIVYKDGLYFGSRNTEFYCLDTKNGTKKWNIHENTGSWMSGSPIINNDTLYFGASDNHLFYAINAISGEILWTHRASVNIFTTPLLFENSICFGTVNSYNHFSGIGTLRILNKQNGNLIHKYSPGCNILSSPVKVNDNIIFGTSRGEVIAVNLNNFITTSTTNNIIENNTLKLEIYNIFPNPCKENIHIEYTIITRGKTKLFITNSYGKTIYIIDDKEKSPGSYSLDCNIENIIGPGLYFITIQQSNAAHTVKFILSE